MTNKNKTPIPPNTYIILSCYNEEETLQEVVEELVERGFNVIITDDGSSDNSPKIAQNLVKKYPHMVDYYRHVINVGLGGAIKTGIQAALSKDAQILITFDADGQHNPEDLYNMYPPIENGEADVVIAARDFNDMPRGRKFGNTVMNYITYIFQGKMVKDSQSGLRAFSRKAAQMITLNSPQYGVSSEIIGEIERKNLKLKEVPMTTIYDQRTIEKGTNLFVGLKIVFEFMNEMFK